MGLNDISFVKGQGGLGRPLPGQDFISAMVFYAANSSLPSGFTVNSRIIKCFSITDAENAGILPDYDDETPATGTITVTGVGTNGNSITINVLEPFGKLVALGTYIKVVGDATTANVATSIAAAINANTATTGYSATVAGSVVTITARPGLGVFLNSATPMSTVIVGTLAVTLAQFVGGVFSLQSEWHYHILRFFTIQQGGVLYVGIYPIIAPYTFTEILTMQQYALGAIRQFGVKKDPASPYTLGDFDLLQGIKATLDAEHMPISIIYAADVSGTEDLSTLGDLSQREDNGASDCLGQDGAAVGAALFYAQGKSITCLGAELGTVALAAVDEDIAWVQKFNIDDGVEFDVVAYANGELDTTIPITSSYRTVLNNQRHIFLRKFVGTSGTSGTYFNDSHTAIAQDSDYAYIEDNRTIDKADRLIYTNLLPYLNGPDQLNDDGTLSNNSIATLTDAANTALDNMVRAGELSGYLVTINPAQNINTAGKLVVAVKLLQEGVSRNIQVNIGYTNSLS
jgi:hypothetical protein